MITSEMYFGKKAHTAQDEEAFAALCERVCALLAAVGWRWPEDPDTGSPISGSRGGSGDGGFRLADSSTGRARSKHKTAHAVDVYDPGDLLDDLIDDALLEEHGLYREHPDDTPGWCHLQDVPPGSGRRTFKP